MGKKTSSKATKVECEIIDRLAHAICIEEIKREVIAKEHPELGESYRSHMKKEMPYCYRLLDELRTAIPRVRKQLLDEFMKNTDEGAEDV